MPCYQKDVCPRCRADVSRRFGVITTPTIDCRVCQFPMRVTSLAVMNNWQFNAAAPVGLALWVAALFIIFGSPETAARWAWELGATPSGHDTQDHLAMALVAGGAALFCSVPFAIVGRIIGFFVARRLLSEPPEPAASEFGQRQYLSYVPAPAASGGYGVAMHSTPELPQQTAGGGFRFIARTFFGLVWAAIFFVGGAFMTTAVAIAGITDPQLRNEASRHAGQSCGVWLFFGSIGLAVLLGSRGILPGTRSKNRQA